MPSLYFLISLVAMAIQTCYCQQKVLSTTGLTLNIKPVGTSWRDNFLNLTLLDIFGAGQVRDLLNSSNRYRLLHAENLDSLSPGCIQAKEGQDPSSAFRAAIADYTNGRTIFVTGDAFEPASSFSATQTNVQPLPNPEEVAEAARLAGFSPKAIAFATMPPLIESVLPNGTSHRILHIMAREPDSQYFVPLFVNMNNGTVEKDAVTLKAPTCDAPGDAGAPVTPPGTPGTVQVTISRGGSTLWTLQVVRASASSGRDGSGVELRSVFYKGKKVLHRAHVPILNVEYKDAQAGCGPTYRDWQNDETAFTCGGRDVAGAPGFRICTAPSRTIVDAPFRDGGNFNGVSFYVDGGEVVIRSQLRAGWYRYTSEWRLATDGTIRPRFGFGGVLTQYNRCVCVTHHHHAYWRFDFDIETASGNRVQEFNDPPIIAGNRYHDKGYEIRRSRDQSRKRHWEVSNTRSGSGYALLPGAGDGNADAYGVGDVWVLKYHADELDDGPRPDTKAHLEKHLTGESLNGQDVVLWYAAHFLHDETHEHKMAGGHVVGPTLKPLKW